MRASSLLTIEMETDSIPTSSFKLDTALNKGIQLCSITEICGGSGSGKTQICLQLTFNTILPAPVGLIDGEAVYISTKRNFHQLRVNHLAENCVKIWEAGRGKSRAAETRKTFTTKDALDRIHHKLVFNAADLMSTVYQLKTMVEQNKKVRFLIKLNFPSFNLIFPSDPPHRHRLAFGSPPQLRAFGEDSDSVRDDSRPSNHRLAPQLRCFRNQRLNAAHRFELRGPDRTDDHEARPRRRFSPSNFAANPSVQVRQA